MDATGYCLHSIPIQRMATTIRCGHRDDCFQWKNLTPAGSSHDIRSPDDERLQTGLKLSGTDGWATAFELRLGWIVNSTGLRDSMEVFSASMRDVQNHIGINGLRSIHKRRGAEEHRNSWNMKETPVVWLCTARRF